MRKVCAVIVIALLMSAEAAAQKRKKPRASARSRASATRNEPAPSGSRMVGSPVIIITKNDDRIVGTLVDLTAYSIRIKADNLESTIALDRIASLSFGGASAPARTAMTSAPVTTDFARNAAPMVGEFQSFANKLQQGTEINEYGRLLTELRRKGEQFINRYGGADNATEARVLALLSAALTDYNWAQSIWRLRLNRSGDTTAFDTDTPALTDALALYPDLRATAAVGNKYSVDKVVSGLWKKAADKTERARSLIPDGR
jgi:hypothetical protein